MKNVFVMLLMGILALTSCSEESSETQCFLFDERQCESDPWAQDIDTPLDSRVKTYLQSKGISVEKISVDMTYHTIVCEACNICPVGPRVYVEIAKDDAGKLTEEGFLDFAEDEECTAKSK